MISDSDLPYDPTNPKPHLDLLRIEFPTDRLTIRAIREKFPQVDAHKLHWYDDIELPGMLLLERDLARAAFDAVLGRRTEMITAEDPEILTKVYIRYGLASGPHHAEQLIRAFQQSAADQAREHLGSQPFR